MHPVQPQLTNNLKIKTILYYNNSRNPKQIQTCLKFSPLGNMLTMQVEKSWKKCRDLNYVFKLIYDHFLKLSLRLHFSNSIGYLDLQFA